MVCRFLALASLTLGLLSPALATATEVGTTIVSGLTWHSGASAPDSFGTWRGRPLDVRVVFLNHDTWDQMLTQLRGAFFRQNCGQTPLCVVSLAMFPRNLPGQFQQCAGGSFDVTHKQIATLIAATRPTAIVRIGWEANSSGNHPWRIGTQANIDPYINCFRDLAPIYQAAGLRTEWTVAKGGTVDAYSTYPGDDVVDFWGLHYYDSGSNPKQEIGAWLALAKSHGKILNVPEWGIWMNGDDVAYIQNMFQFFSANASSIGYENYYNRNSAHELYPSTRFSAAANAYSQLW